MTKEAKARIKINQLLQDTKNNKKQTWQHPGGKLRELGAEKLTNSELLAILISTGDKRKSAEDIAKEIINKYGSFKGLANQPLFDLKKISGLGDVKIIRIAAAFEIARRVCQQVLQDYVKENQ